LFWTYIYMHIHCTYRNYHDSNAILFDVIVIYSIDLSWTQRMGRELQHRTTTILSVHHVLMFPVVVGGDIAWRCYYVQRGDVTVVIVQSTTLNTDIESYALPTLSIHWITFALSNHSQRRHHTYNPPRLMKLSYITFRFI